MYSVNIVDWSTKLYPIMEDETLKNFIGLRSIDDSLIH